MPAKPPINQLDPFGDSEDEFKTKEIRHSRSREVRNFFVRLFNPKDKKDKRAFALTATFLIVIIICSVLFIVFQTRRPIANPTASDNPLVNPTGREASSEYTTDNTEDPELRASEQEKLNTVLSLLAREDWEYGNALFETIFPDYLDACGKYDYYRAAVLLADNFEGFTIDREVANSRKEILLKKCDRN